MTTIRRGTTTMPTLSIERRQLPEVPVLLIRRRIPRDQLAATIGECFGLLWDFAQKAGLAETGRPTVRYQAVGPGYGRSRPASRSAAKAVGARGDRGRDVASRRRPPSRCMLGSTTNCSRLTPRSSNGWSRTAGARTARHGRSTSTIRRSPRIRRIGAPRCVGRSQKVKFGCGARHRLCMMPPLSGAGWSSLVARRAHNPKVAGSNPAPAPTSLVYSGHMGDSSFRAHR